jgi:hypothetical protein
MLLVNNHCRAARLLLPSTAYLQLHQQAAALATLLSRLWNQSAHAKLLHQMPARTKPSAKHNALMHDSTHCAVELHRAVDRASPLCVERVQQGEVQCGLDFIEEVLAAKPAATLARLLVWLQQHAELLELHAQDVGFAATARGSNATRSSRPSADYGQLWLHSTIGT